MRPMINPQPGDVLGGKYRIESKLGSGGMGSVYLAVDITLGRKVAVKALDPKMAADSQLQQRFEREARVARHLQHPNTIQIFDYGQTENGLPFIVMEYLRGRDIETIIQQEGAINMGRTLAVAKQVLMSLAEAHNAGVIHRDLKPSNVIVGDFGGQKDFVKVLDFGIAKLLDAERDSGALKTRSGMILGSPAYMAPERIRSLQLTPASDIYSLGVMMAEMMAGKAMFDGRTPLEVMADRLGGSPFPIPDWLKVSPVGPILDKATRWEARERYQTAFEMIGDIDRILDGGSSQPTQPSGSQDEWGYGSVEATLKMDSDSMDLSKPRGADPGHLASERVSMWSNPANVILLVVIIVLVIATTVIIAIGLS